MRNIYRPKSTNSNAGLLALYDRIDQIADATMRAVDGDRALATSPGGANPVSELLAVNDGIAIELEPRGTPSLDKETLAKIDKELPDGWKLEDDSSTSTSYRGVLALPPPGGVLDVGAAWEQARELSRISGVRSVTPLFAQVAPNLVEQGQQVDLGFSSLEVEGPPDWHLGAINVPAAWEALRAEGKEPGQGVTVAVIDTGYTKHPEIWERLTKEGGNPQVVRGVDLLDGADPLDPLERGGLFPSPSHGTAVTSVIASPPGAQSDSSSGDSTQHINGIAPAAQVYPIRATTSIVLLLPTKLNKALRETIKPGVDVDVINISLGTAYGWPSLHAAIRDVVNQGVIVVAASGNIWPAVVYPAAFPEVLAAAAGMPTTSAQPWLPSSAGPEVDVLAPGAGIQRALTTVQDGASEPSYGIGQGTGTTYAAACCTSLAALWLTKHGGRQALIEHYGGQKHRVPQAFHYLLRKTARSQGVALNGRYGAGVPDAPALLIRRLPTIEELEDDNQELQLSLAAVGGAENSSLYGLPLLEAMGATDMVEEGLGVLLNLGPTEQLGELLLRELHFQLASRPALTSTARNMLAEGRVGTLRAQLLEIGQLSPTLTSRLTEAATVAADPQASSKRAIAAEEKRVERGTISDPAARRLVVYATDPSLTTSVLTSRYNSVTIAVPWEEVEPGPIGEYLEVVDIDPASAAVYAPVDLSDPRLLARDGFEPSEGDPRFHQQMVYAVAMKTIQHFERALGRPAFWYNAPYQDESGRWHSEPFNRRLRIYPHALRVQNAYYSRDKRALLFGYFPSPGPGTLSGPTVFTCLSYDIIAHETTHALLDGMYRHYTTPTNPDVRAFHEAFSDIVALFQKFTHPELLRAAIEQTQGNLEEDSQLGKLAVQFGQATGRRGALRDAIGTLAEDGSWIRNKPNANLLQSSQYRVSTYARGSILVAAVFDAFLLLYKERARPIIRLATGGSGVLPIGNLPVDLAGALAEAAAKTAGHMLNICIRALDYLPPIDVTFGEYLRAIITADRDLVPNDPHGYRVAFAQAFRAWGIQPEDVSTVAPENLCWQGPEEAARQFALNSNMLDSLNRLITRWRVTHDRYDLHRGSLDEKRKLHELLRGHQQAQPDSALGSEIGMDLSQSFEVHTLRPASSIGPSGETNPLVVVTLTQKKEEVQAEGEWERKEPIRRGSTILFSLGDGSIRYVIHRGDSSNTRGAAIREFNEFLNASAGEIDPYRLVSHQDEPFALMHLTGRS